MKKRKSDINDTFIIKDQNIMQKFTWSDVASMHTKEVWILPQRIVSLYPTSGDDGTAHNHERLKA